MRRLALLVLALSMATPSMGVVAQTALSADGLPIAYERHGTKGPVLILVHGWTNNRSFWDPHAEALARDFQVVTLDLAGFGESDKGRATWTMEGFGRDVAAVVEALEVDRVFLVGFSMGGAAVLEAAALLEDQVAGVVLVDVFHDVNERYDQATIDTFVEREQRLWHDMDYLREDFAPDAPDTLPQRYIDNTPPQPPSYWFDIIRSYFAWRNTQLTRTIAQVTAPIAAINAEYRPTEIEAFRRYAPSFQVRTMPGVGHLGVIWMNTDDFDGFLRELISSMGAPQPIGAELCGRARPLPSVCVSS